MTNFHVYKKTLPFSLVSFLISLLSLAVLAGASTAGYFIAKGNSEDAALIGLGVGFLIGAIVVILINIFLLNRLKAAQIAMMTKGVTEGNLPSNTFHAGFKEIRGRFGSIFAFFLIVGAIKGVFRQVGNRMTKLGKTVGGQTGETVASIIDSAIQVLIGYLSDCCLGWILYRKGVNAAKAGCEGAVIFFKHGKTLLKNVGRIFGLGLLSLLLVGGAFTGLFYVIYLQFPNMFETLATTIAGSGEDIPAALTDPKLLTLYVIFYYW